MLRRQLGTGRACPVATMAPGAPSVRAMTNAVSFDSLRAISPSRPLERGPPWHVVTTRARPSEACPARTTSRLAWHAAGASGRRRVEQVSAAGDESAAECGQTFRRLISALKVSRFGVARSPEIRIGDLFGMPADRTAHNALDHLF